ncbi:protein dead ringer-like isoform X2 [Cimex lectularius]|uniref:Protein dead ringer n=1 Tax=Cimex lectularius TaxID=79782 RepID=A0A8I6S759_CIMLE|nr:protein dead ringer-like isoform X2 [Cimex lectularius]
MEMDRRDSDLEGSVAAVSRMLNISNAEMSEPEEDVRDPPSLVKIKQEREESKIMSAPPAMVAPPPFSLPITFPFPHPPYPPTAPNFPTNVHPPSSASSHSSESSSSSQQTWSFEEQFKQLYEISDDPKRKEFLDDLFSFMQRRGTPINRLPIMAKSVLDLYELYNLVIQRGGLVDVINKKLWQEIIKGLHLPSSITSAAFTLRTQYMKYLYPYECEKRRLSTPGELQAAIDGNRREGRRGSYGTYAEMLQRSPGQQSPLSLVTGRALNGSTHHHNNNNNHIPPHHQSLLPPNITGNSGMVPAEFEARMVEYVKLLNKELRSSTSTPPLHRQNSPPSSPPESTSGVINPLEMSRFTLWNLYHSASQPEPQKEALNLEKRDEPIPPPPPKRHYPDNNEDINISGAHIKISSRGDGRGGSENSLVVSMDINGTIYQGVLFAQAARNNNRLQS